MNIRVTYFERRGSYSWRRRRSRWRETSMMKWSCWMMALSKEWSDFDQHEILNIYKERRKNRTSSGQWKHCSFSLCLSRSLSLSLCVLMAQISSKELQWERDIYSIHRYVSYTLVFCKQIETVSSRISLASFFSHAYLIERSWTCPVHRSLEQSNFVWMLCLS